LRLKEPVAKAHQNLGSILCSQGRFEEGVPHLERAIAINPELSAAHANLGEAYGALGRRAQAARQFALAVEREPNKPFLLNRLGWLSPRHRKTTSAMARGRSRWANVRSA
jgi:Tfp pilus assembly protein PilF